jgi:hypothetical protein
MKKPITITTIDPPAHAKYRRPDSEKWEVVAILDCRSIGGGHIDNRIRFSDGTELVVNHHDLKF